MVLHQTVKVKHLSIKKMAIFFISINKNSLIATTVKGIIKSKNTYISQTSLASTIVTNCIKAAKY